MRTVIFFREGHFYPIDLPDGQDGPEHIADHAELNPGTLRVEGLDGEVLWSAPNKQ